MKLSLDRIRPNPNQPRKRFAGIDTLADSIKAEGLLEPLLVRPVAGRDYEIIHGHRRWLAARQAGLTEVEAVVREATDSDAFRLAVVENVQREDLGPIEEAAAYQELQKQGLTQEAIGRMVGKSQSYVAHKLRLLGLPAPLTAYLQDGSLTENHIRQVLRVKQIYGTALPASPFPESFGPDSIGTPDEAAALIHETRPEEVPALWRRGVPVDTPPAVVEGCRAFADYVLKHTGRLAQWELSSFWWSSMAVWYHLTVTDLTRRLDGWQERYEHALLHRHLHPDEEPADAWAAGYHADLKHSASLDADLINPDRLVRVGAGMLAGGKVAPSAVQFGKSDAIDPKPTT